MQNYERCLVVTLVLGILSVFGLFLMVLSLLDIYRGTEPDLSAEWTIVALGLLIIFLFCIAGIFTAIRLLRQNTKLT